jgi:ferric iron reductase protein FhuF
MVKGGRSIVQEQLVFSREEKEKLEQLRLTFGGKGEHTAQQLLDSEQLKALLERLVSEGHFPSVIVAGSQFMKRYGFMTLAPILYAFTMWDKPILAGPDELEIAMNTQAAVMQVTIPNSLKSSEKERADIRAELANKLINENLAPFVETMVKATKLSAAILWENAAIYLFWVYETLIPSEGNAEQVSRAKEDFHYLLKEFNCTSFTCGANPFMPYYSEKVERDDGPIRFRRTCCLYDQISEGGACCKTCPKAR